MRTREMQIFGQGMAPIDVIAMTVTNTGRRATVLQSVHLTLGTHTLSDRLWPARLRPTQLRGTKSIMPSASTELPQLNAAAVLPKRLEPGDEVTTYVQAGYVRQALHESQGIEFTPSRAPRLPVLPPRARSESRSRRDVGGGMTRR